MKCRSTMRQRYNNACQNHNTFHLEGNTQYHNKTQRNILWGNIVYQQHSSLFDTARLLDGNMSWSQVPHTYTQWDNRFAGPGNKQGMWEGSMVWGLDILEHMRD